MSDNDDIGEDLYWIDEAMKAPSPRAVSDNDDIGEDLYWVGEAIKAESRNPDLDSKGEADDFVSELLMGDMGDMLEGALLGSHAVKFREGKDMEVTPLSESISDKVTVQNFIVHYLVNKCGLKVCSTQSCNLVCRLASCFCRKCSKESNVVSTAANDEGSTLSPHSVKVDREMVEKVEKSREYVKYIAKPCSSPKKGNKKAYRKSTAVQELLPPECGSWDFGNIVYSYKRGYQVGTIPTVVYIMMKALGFDRDAHAPLRELICSIILHETFPRSNGFLFSASYWRMKLKEMQYEPEEAEEIAVDASIVVWSSIFLLDLLAYGKCLGMHDVVANVFLTEQGSNKMNADYVFLFASISYACYVSMRVIGDKFVKEAKSAKGGENRSCMSVNTFNPALKGPIIKSVIESFATFGCFPQLSGSVEELKNTNPSMRAFYEVCSSTSQEDLKQSVIAYLDSMPKSVLPASSDNVVNAILSKTGTLSYIAMLQLAYAGHLHQNVLGGNVSAFDYSPMQSDPRGGTIRLIRCRDMQEEDNLSLGCFALRASELCETDLLKILYTTLKPLDYAAKFGLDCIEKKCSEHVFPFSINFKPTDNDTFLLESLMAKIKANPEEYLNDPRFNYMVSRLHGFMAEVVSVAGNGAMISAQSTSALLNESLETRTEFPIFDSLKNC